LIKRVIDSTTLGSMNLFERITHVSPMDCVITDNNVLFVVNRGLLRKSIGRDASSIKRLKEKFKKNVRIVEYNPNIEVFIKYLMSNIQIISVSEQDDTVHVTINLKHRGLAIGKGGEIIKRNRDIIKRLYGKELKLITK